MSKTLSTVDEIFAVIYIVGISSGLHREITDADEINHRKEAFIKANPLNIDAKAQLRTLVEKFAEELIGEDVPYNMNNHATINAKNNLKSEQRQNVPKLLEQIFGEAK